MILDLVLLIFILFYAPVSISSSKGKEIDSCIKIKNITVFSNIRIKAVNDDTQQQYRNEPQLDQFSLSIKSLLRLRCTLVWVYSPKQKRSIRMSESNWQRFLDTELAMSNFVDENEFLEFTSKIPEVNGMVDQTFLYVYFHTYHLPMGEEHHKLKIISKELEHLQNSKKVNVIVMVDHPKFFLLDSKRWLPIHRALVTETSYQSRVMDQQTHKDLLDVLRNPNYNRFEFYDDLKCLNGRKWKIYLWRDKWNYGINIETISYFYLYYIFFVRYPKYKMLHVEEYFQDDRSVAYLYHYYDEQGFYQRGYNTPVEKLMEILRQQRIIIHLNIERKKTFFKRNSQPFTIGHTINITLDNDLPKSPVLQNGRFTLWEEDLYNPVFINQLIRQMNLIMCDQKYKSEL